MNDTSLPDANNPKVQQSEDVLCFINIWVIIGAGMVMLQWERGGEEHVLLPLRTR